MLVAATGAVLLGVSPRAGAEPVDLELLRPPTARPVSWLWVTLDGTWFGRRTPAPGEWCWRGERRALACDSDALTAELTLADGPGFAPVLSDGVGTFADGPCGSGGGGGGGLVSAHLASCTSTPGGADSAGWSPADITDAGFSSSLAASGSVPLTLTSDQDATVTGGTALNSGDALASEPLVLAEENLPVAATTPLPAAALSGATILGGVGLVRRRRTSR
jgi:hypothetical protein